MGREGKWDRDLDRKIWHAAMKRREEDLLCEGCAHPQVCDVNNAGRIDKRVLRLDDHARGRLDIHNRRGMRVVIYKPYRHRNVVLIALQQGAGGQMHHNRNGARVAEQDSPVNKP